MSGAIALAAGTLLAVGALAFVLYPLFFGAADRRPRPRAAASGEDSAIRALREIEFDRATGKLSDADYADLRRTYGEKAVRELRLNSVARPQAKDDDVEARVLAYRTTHRDCRTCGLRPETDAIYCSNCGAYLDEKCPECGAGIVEPSAGFCSRCGTLLAVGV